MSRTLLTLGLVIVSGHCFAETVELPPVTVTETAMNSGGLNLDESTQVGSRLGLATKDIPASVEIIDHDTMQRRGSRTLQEAVERAAGISNISTPGDGAAAFSSRGFTGNNALMQLYNGTRFYVGAGTFTLPLDTWHLDRIEVLRGPASVLYGEGAIGGAINLVTKKPNPKEFEHEALFSYGSWDTTRIGLGSGGPINDQLSYRVDVSRQSSHAFIDRADYERWTLASSLQYDITDRLKVTLSFDYWINDDSTYFGTPLINGVVDPRIRRSNFNILDSKARYEDYWTRLKTEWQATDDIQLTNELYAYKTDRHWRNLEEYAFNANTGLLDRSGFLEIIHDQLQIGNRFQALITKPILDHGNRFLIGFDVNSIDFSRPTNDFSGADSIDPFNPVLGNFVNNSGTTLQRESSTHQVSLFAEDTIDLLKELKLVGGLRYEHINVDATHLVDASQSFEKNFDPFTWRVGLVYQPIPSLSLYAQRSTGVDPVSSILTVNQNNRDFGLSKGRQYEVGLKHSLWDKRFEWTLALFDIEKKNLLTRDLDNPGQVLQVGQQSSQGLELTAALRPLPEWSIEGNFSWLDAKFDNFIQNVNGVAVSLAGNDPANVPETLGNVWLYYTPTHFLDFGVGARYVGARKADNTNLVHLAGYTAVDIFATWHCNDHVSLTARGRNLSNEEYTIAPYTSSQVILGDPRAFEVALKVNF